MGTLTRFAVKNAIFLAQKPLPTNSNATNVLLNFKRLSQSLSSNVSVVSLTRTGVEHRLENRISSSSFLLNEQSSTTKSNNIHLLNGVKIESAFLARQFINTLDLNERQIIKEELIKAENELKQLGGFYLFSLVFVGFNKQIILFTEKKSKFIKDFLINKENG